MRTHFLATGLACLLLALAVTAASAASRINGVEPEREPFTYLDPFGRPGGFDVDAINWIAREMGFAISHVPLDPNDPFSRLLAGDVDMVSGGLHITPEALKQTAFSRPYSIIRNVFVVMETNALTRADVMTGKKRLGVQRATARADWLAEERAKDRANYTLQYYDSVAELLDDLVAGRIDAGAMIAHQAEEAIHEGEKPVVIIGDFGPSNFYAIALRPNDAALAESVNEGIGRLMADPYWEELRKKYFRHGR